MNEWLGTHTNLWKEQFGTKIINGDLNLIGWSNGEQTNIGQSVDKPGSKGHPIVYGMPWCGTSGIASTKSYPDVYKRQWKQRAN